MNTKFNKLLDLLYSYVIFFNYNLKMYYKEELNKDSLIDINKLDMEKIGYIATIKLDNIENYNQALVSSIFIYDHNLLEINNLIKNFKYYPNKLRIIFKVKWNIELNDTLEESKESYIYTDNRNIENHIIIINLSYHKLFNFLSKYDDNINKILNENNIQSKYDYSSTFVFYGIHWSIITYLFNMYGYTLNGGSISRRHILSLLQFDLSEFLLESGIYNKLGRKCLYYLYTNKLLINNKIDREFYLLNKKEIDSKSFLHKDPQILEYILKNEYIMLNISLKDKLEILNNMNEKNNDMIRKKDNYLRNIDFNDNELLTLNRDLIYLKSKMNKNISKKNALVTGGRLNKIKDSINILRDDILEYEKQIKNITETLLICGNDVTKLKSSIDNIMSSINNLKSKNTKSSSYNPNNNKSNNNLKSLSITNKKYNKRYYSTYISKNSIDIKSSLEKTANDNILNLMEKNQDIKKICGAIDFKNISNIFNNDSTNLKEKQQQIEDCILEIFNLNKIKNIKNESSIMNSTRLNLIKNNLNELDLIFFDTFKKKIPKPKKRQYWFISNNDSSIVISIVFNKIITFLIRYADIENQKINQLYKDIGKEVYNTFIKQHYMKYLHHFGYYSYKSTEGNLLDSISSDMNSINLIKNNFVIEDIVFKDKIYFKEGLNYIDFAKELENYLFTKDPNFEKDIDSRKIQIGHLLVYTFGDSNKYYNINNKFLGPNNTIIYITPTSLFEDIMDNFSIKNISHLPMICEPNEWKTSKLKSKCEKIEKNRFEDIYEINKFGGYLTNQINSESLIRSNNKNKGKTLIERNDIIDTINYLQKIPLTINKKVLSHILNYINEDIQLKDPLFFKLHSESISIKSLKDSNYDKYIEILRHNSLANKNIRTIASAILFKDFNFYCPVYMDWRGRFYTYNNLLSYQGDELTKSLLYFGTNKGQVLNDDGIKALKIYASNCYGLSKLSYNDRIKWCDSNISDIININENFINLAKEKLLFLAASYELKEYYKDPNNFISRLPIFIDATCNGLQHLSAMVSDLNLANFVNLTKSSIENEPKDLYEVMAKLIKENLINNNNNLYINLKKLNITRSFIKKCIMTIPYGVTIIGMKNELISQFFKIDRKYFSILDNNDKKKYYKLNSSEFLTDMKDYDTFRLNDRELLSLSNLIHSTLYNTYPSLKILVKYLKEINGLFKKLNLNIGIMWKTPSGLILEQKYFDQERKTYTISINGRRKSFSLKVNKNTINLERQNYSIVPNLIHSLDSSNISLLVNKIINDKKYIDLITIHDCFATDANNISYLNFQTRYAFVRIYQNQDFIDNYHKFILNILTEVGFTIVDNFIILDNNKIKIPIKPNFNKSFDLKYNLFNSPYFLN